MNDQPRKRLQRTTAKRSRQSNFLDGGAIARELRDLESGLTRDQHWPEDSTAFAAVAIEGALATVGRDVLIAHRRYHRSHGRTLCEGICAAYDLCAYLKLTLDAAGVAKPAPVWLLIVEGVKRFTGADLPDCDSVRRAISRHLVGVREAIQTAEDARSPAARRLIGRYGAVVHFLEHQGARISSHPDDISKPR